MKSQHGEFSITAISYLNNLVSAIDSNVYQNASNKEMVKLVEEAKAGRMEEVAAWDGYEAIKNRYTVEEQKEFVKTSTSGNKEYYKYLIKKTIKLGAFNIGTNYAENEKLNYENLYSYFGQVSLPITFGTVYIMIAISAIYLIWYLIKYKNINWVIAFFAVLIIANLFTLIVGAPFEPQRLFSTSIEVVLLLIAYVAGKVKVKGEEDEKITI